MEKNHYRFQMLAAVVLAAEAAAEEKQLKEKVQTAVVRQLRSQAAQARLPIPKENRVVAAVDAPHLAEAGVAHPSSLRLFA